MNKLIGSAIVLVAAGTLAGCAQTPPMQHGMMMGSMPMMTGRSAAGAPDMDKMMAMCMEHMQVMSGSGHGAKPPQAPAR